MKEFSTYHEELRLFKVIDTFSHEIIGYFYTDLHPRDGKYGHAAVFGIKVKVYTEKQNYTEPFKFRY